MQIVNINQVRGNKNNPRVIKDERFKKLVESIKFFPEMLWKRCLVVESNEKGFTVLGGNQRLRAINEIFKMPRHELAEQVAGVNNEKTILAFYDSKQIPITLCDDWTLEQKREFIVRDNIDFGQWDMDKLSTEYEMEELEDWGLEPLGKETESKDIFNEVDKKFENDIHSYNPDVKFDKEIGDYDIPKLLTDKIYRFDSRTISTHISTNPIKTDLHLWIVGSSKIPESMKNIIIGFYTDDYRFEKCYNDPSNFVKQIKDLNILACCMPNFSMYAQWARAVRIYNLYRSFWVGRYFQECGIDIIPDLQLNKEDYGIVKSIYPTNINSVSIQFHTSKKDKNFIIEKIDLLKDICEYIKPESLMVYTDSAFMREINLLDSIKTRIIPILSYMETKRFQGVI